MRKPLPVTSASAERQANEDRSTFKVVRARPSPRISANQSPNASLHCSLWNTFPLQNVTSSSLGSILRKHKQDTDENYSIFLKIFRCRRIFRAIMKSYRRVMTMQYIRIINDFSHTCTPFWGRIIPSKPTAGGDADLLCRVHWIRESFRPTSSWLRATRRGCRKIALVALRRSDKCYFHQVVETKGKKQNKIK